MRAPTHGPSRTPRWVMSFLAAVLVTCLVPVQAAPFEDPLPPLPPVRLDVPYVPTPHSVVRRMLEMADVQPDDHLVDLGSGDGRIVIAAVRDWQVKRAQGIDLDPVRVSEARANARLAGIEDRVTFEEGDLFEKDFSEATVLTMFLLPRVNLRLLPVIQETLAPGTRVVSHAFDMGAWEPDYREMVEGNYVYLWIVPARVAGDWRVTTEEGDEFTLTLYQTHQAIHGSAVKPGRVFTLEETLLRGDQIRFSIDGQKYAGRIDGDTMQALDDDGVVKSWHARRF